MKLFTSKINELDYNYVPLESVLDACIMAFSVLLANKNEIAKLPPLLGGLHYYNYFRGLDQKCVRSKSELSKDLLF